MKNDLQPVSSMARVVRQLVGFSRRELRGFGVLLTALAVLVALPVLVSHWLLPSSAPLTAATTDEVRALDRVAAKLEQAELDQRRARYASADTRSGGFGNRKDARRWSGEGRGATRYTDRTGAAPAAPVALLKTLRPFDPNALSALDWQRRGVPADVARRLVSYGQKAGGYRYREQLERIHGLSPALLARLAPYLQLPSRADQYGPRPERTAYAARPDRPAYALGSGGAGGASSTLAATAGAYAAPREGFATGYVRKPRTVRAFDLNTADTLTLMQLRGIGQRRAARIVEMREKLGGFVSPAQLAEVWGLDPALIDSLAKYGHIAADFRPRPLPINSASLEELRNHPYIGPRLARVITAYREQHGPFARAEDLRLIKVIEEGTYHKLEPYLAMR